MKKSALPNPKTLLDKIKKAAPKKPKQSMACSGCKGTGTKKGHDCKTCGGSGALFV